MSNAKVESIKTRLFILKEQNASVQITMKSAKLGAFTAKVGDFLFDEDDTKVVFLRCSHTKFPDDGLEKKDHYVTYLKNINQVDRFEE